MHRIAVVAVCLVAANLAHAMSVAPSGYEVKHVFATVRAARHTPTNYRAGWDLVKKSVPPAKLVKECAVTAYSHGQQLGKRYQTDLVGAGNFSDNNIWAFGGNYSWTNQSAWVTRAGTKGDQQGKNEAKYVADAKEWTPLDQNLLNQFSKFTVQYQCPAVMRIVAAMKSQLESVLGKYKTELEIVANNTKASIIYNPEKSWLISESLQTMKAANQTPSWATEEVQKALDDIAVYFLHKVQSITEIKKIAGGRIASVIIRDMKKLKSGKEQPDNPTNATMSLFATSQALIAGQVAAFNPEGTKFNGKAFTKRRFYPRQGAMHVIELLKPKSNIKWKLRVLYANGENVKRLSPVQLPGCTNNGVCDYIKFVKIAVRATEAELEEACKLIQY